jgi:group I intron endonuclease
MIGYIYCATCLTTGKLYFGQTIRLVEERWERHIQESRSGSNYKFHRAIRKYGEENFLVEEVLTVSAPTKDALKAKLDYIEIRLIRKFDTFRNGYNMTLGGEGQFGRIFSEESRRKMSESAKKRCTDKFRKEKSMLMNKLRENKSFVKKQCAASKIALLNPEVQKKLGIGRRGRPFSKEHRRKIGQAVSGERNGMYSRKILV